MPSVIVAPSGNFVVCGDAARVVNCDLDVDPSIDLVFNGSPSAVAVVTAPVGGARQSLIDTGSNGGDVPGDTEGSGVLEGDDDTEDVFGISRWPNGVDTDNNSVAFSGRCHTPGLENIERTTDRNPVPVDLIKLRVE